MMPRARRSDLVELFGYSSRDLSETAESHWQNEICPFTGLKCAKHNHDQSITYGTCSVYSSGDEIIICPNRLYAENSLTIRNVAVDAFGEGIPLLTFSQYIKTRKRDDKFVVALGQSSGKEVRVARSLSMDWVLALIENRSLVEYVGIEVQSIDITGNYRRAWQGYKKLRSNPSARIPASGHGLNWANVHKRLIPQLIRKGLVYSRSSLVKRGLYFVVPDIVYKRFEDVVGPLTSITAPQNDTITVHTYGLGPEVPEGQHRMLSLIQTFRFTLAEFSQKFISGPNLPSGNELDEAVLGSLGLRR